MNRKLFFLLNALLLAAIIYFKFFNETTAALISKHFQLQAILAFVIFYIIVSFLSHIVKYFYSRRNKIPKDKKNNVHFGIENIGDFTIGLGLLITLLSLFGINPKELITSLTIVAAALAILTKEYIVDFLSGIYLSFSNTFDINDYVKIDDQKGKIVEIGMLKVKILNDNEDVMIIPNSKVHYSDIINYTQKDASLVTIDFQISLKNIENIAQLEKEIITALAGFSALIEPNSYNLTVEKMKMDHIEVKFKYTLKSKDLEERRNIRKKTMKEVFNLISGKKEFVMAGK